MFRHIFINDMSIETIIGGNGNKADIQRRRIPQIAAMAMEVGGGQMHHGDKAVLYVSEKFSDYCLKHEEDWQIRYQGIIVARVIIRPSVKFLVDFSRKDVDVTGVMMGTEWGGVRKLKGEGWEDEVVGYGLKDNFSNMGRYFPELNPAKDAQKVCVISAGEFRKPFHQLTTRVNIKDGSVQFVEKTWSSAAERTRTSTDCSIRS
jgi:hypothetical protein